MKNKKRARRRIGTARKPKQRRRKRRGRKTRGRGRSAKAGRREIEEKRENNRKGLSIKGT